MPTVTANAVNLYYDEIPPEAALPRAQGLLPLVFLHGFTLDRRMWRPQVDFFGGRYRLLVVDARGHGLSDAPPTGYSRADRVEDLKGFVDGVGIDRFHLIGLSMGGSTGIGFALKYQHRLASLTLVSSGAAGYNIGKKIERIDQIARERGIEAARTKWKDTSLRYFGARHAEIKQQLAVMMDEHSGAVWADPQRGRYPREEDLARVGTIGVPTLIIAGANDKVFAQLAGELHRRIPASSLLVYENVGHMVNMEAPDRFNTDLDRFLQTQNRRQVGTP